MAMHGSQPLTHLDPEKDAQWAYVRMCLDGLYNNHAHVTRDDQAALWSKLSTRHLIGINNLKGQSDDPHPQVGEPGRLPYGSDTLKVERGMTVAYTNNVNLWSNLTVNEIRQTLVHPKDSPESAWKGVYTGYDLRGWQDPTAPGGPLSTAAARTALAQADGAMVECIGGLCGSKGTFGDAFGTFVETVHGQDKPILMFASHSGKPPVNLGWAESLKKQYARVEASGGWRSDDVAMVIPYQGAYPTLPMTMPDGSAADTVTGMLYWALHQ